MGARDIIGDGGALMKNKMGRGILPEVDLRNLRGGDPERTQNGENRCQVNLTSGGKCGFPRRRKHSN